MTDLDKMLGGTPYEAWARQAIEQGTLRVETRKDAVVLRTVDERGYLHHASGPAEIVCGRDGVASVSYFLHGKAAAARRIPAFGRQEGLGPEIVEAIGKPEHGIGVTGTPRPGGRFPASGFPNGGNGHFLGATSERNANGKEPAVHGYFGRRDDLERLAGLGGEGARELLAEFDKAKEVDHSAKKGRKDGGMGRDQEREGPPDSRSR